MPCDPVFRADSVADVFGGHFDPNTYGTKWIAYSWDGEKYKEMPENGGRSEDDILKPGVGYWIIQVTGNSVVLDMPEGATATENKQCSEKAPDNKCFITGILKTKSGGVGWNMLGNPYNVDFPVKKLRISLGRAGGGIVPPNTPQFVGFTLKDAETKKLFHGEIFRYNGKTYDILDDKGTLSPWEAFWGATLDQADAKDLVLKFEN